MKCKLSSNKNYYMNENLLPQVVKDMLTLFQSIFGCDVKFRKDDGDMSLKLETLRKP